MNFGNLFAGLGSLATSISTAVNPPPTAIPGAPGVLYIPSTGQLVGTSSITGTSSTSLLLILGIGVLVLFLLKK